MEEQRTPSTQRTQLAEAVRAPDDTPTPHTCGVGEGKTVIGFDVFLASCIGAASESSPDGRTSRLPRRYFPTGGIPFSGSNAHLQVCALAAPKSGL